MKETAWAEFLERRAVASTPPFRASIEVTRNCGLRCVMCAHSWRPEYRRRDAEFEMTPALFRRLVDGLFPHLESANFQGYGETTVSPHWEDFLDVLAAHAGRISYEIVTNLVRRGPVLWKRMADLDFHFIVSCDGATEETFRAIRDGSRLSSVLENLEVIRAAGGRKPTLLVTLQERNARELPLFVELAARTGAREVVFSSVADEEPVPLEDAARRLSGVTLASAAAWTLARLRKPRVATLKAVPQQELRELVARTRERSKQLGLPVRFNDAALAEPRETPSLENLCVEEGIAESVRVAAHRRCFKPYSTIVVNYRGDVGLCNHLISDGNWEQMGSLATDSIETIWNNARYRDLRARLARGEPVGGGCRWCHLRREGE